MVSKLLAFTLQALFIGACYASARSKPFSLSRSIQNVRHSQTQDNANKIIDLFTTGELKGETYNRLANFTDTIGNRLSGTDNLRRAEDYLSSLLLADAANYPLIENVHLEQVQIPHWERGTEWVQLDSIRATPYRMSMLGLGGSVATNGVLTAPGVVVSSFDELSALASSEPESVLGHIVIFNQECDWKTKPVNCYGDTVNYRVDGANQAAQYGAVAVLVRSVASFSINSPHTGTVHYTSANKIPAASITIEDAALLARLSARKLNITISLYMEAASLGNAPGHNVVAEIKGSTFPDETVIVSGHLDSWDVGQGAMDDGGGFAISWLTLTALAKLNIRPQRTIRFVAWSCEEFGGIGAQQYYDAHSSEVSTMSLVMESDLGVFKPTGIEFTGTTEANAVMTEIGQLLTRINASSVVGGGEGTDIDPWMQQGVPGVSLGNDDEKYFYFHHSNGDTMSVLNSDDVDLAAATWAVTAYSVADLDSLLPRTPKGVYVQKRKNW